MIRYVYTYIDVIAISQPEHEEHDQLLTEAVFVVLGSSIVHWFLTLRIDGIRINNELLYWKSMRNVPVLWKQTDVDFLSQ